MSAARREPASVAAGRDGLFRVWEPARQVWHGPFESGEEAADFADALDRRGRPAAKRPQPAPSTLSLEAYASRRHTPVQAERPPRGVDPTVPDLHHSTSGLWYVWSPADGRYLGPYETELQAQYRLGELLHPRRATAPKPEQGSLFRPPPPKQGSLFGNPGRCRRCGRRGCPCGNPGRSRERLEAYARALRASGAYTRLRPAGTGWVLEMQRDSSRWAKAPRTRWAQVGHAMTDDEALRAAELGAWSHLLPNPARKRPAPPRPRKVPINVIELQVRPRGPLSGREIHALQVLLDREARGPGAARLPPGTPYRCEEPEVGRTVAGKDYGGRVLGCMTPPRGRRPLLLVGGTVPLSRLRADAKRRAGLSCRAAVKQAEGGAALYGEVLERCPRVEDAMERYAIRSEGGRGGGRREPGVPFDPARFGSGGAETGRPEVDYTAARNRGMNRPDATNAMWQRHRDLTMGEVADVAARAESKLNAQRRAARDELTAEILDLQFKIKEWENAGRSAISQGYAWQAEQHRAKIPPLKAALATAEERLGAILRAMENERLAEKYGRR